MRAQCGVRTAHACVCVCVCASLSFQMRQTSEAELSREVLELQDQLRRAQERAETAHKSKQAYKEQVRCLPL